MRLWHKDFIKYLPREQLVAQWRELSAIAGNILTKDTPNHILVNKIMNYSFDHFISYAYYVRHEMNRRKYRTMDSVWNKICSVANHNFKLLAVDETYPDWHNIRYLKRCYHNLEEKYDCCGIAKEDFEKIKYEYEEQMEENV